MKKHLTSVIRLCTICAVALVAAVAFTACSEDNDEPKIADPQTFIGELTTTLPSMPNFEVVVCDDTATLTWLNVEQSEVSIELGAFTLTISTPMGERQYEIGSMNIPNVPCVKNGNKITIPEYEFECQAGNYATTGKVSGVLENGVLTATFNYKPGSMPFDVQSVFKSK